MVMLMYHGVLCSYTLSRMYHSGYHGHGLMLSWGCIVVIVVHCYSCATSGGSPTNPSQTHVLLVNLGGSPGGGPGGRFGVDLGPNQE